MIPPSLTLSNIRYVSRVKWSNPGKWVAPSPTPQCSSYWKGSLLVALDYSCQLYLLTYYPPHCRNYCTKPLQVLHIVSKYPSPPLYTYILSLFKIKNFYILGHNCNIYNSISSSSRIHWLHLCKGVRLPLPNKCLGYDSKLHLMVRLQSWSFEEWKVLLYYSQVHSDPD